MTVAYLASTRIDAPLSFVWTHLTDARRVGRWALGSMDFQPAGPGLWRGQSLFDGSEAIVEVRPHRALGLIDYHVGTLEARVPRVSIRAVAGGDWGQDAGCTLAAMSTWRAGWMDDARWARTCTTHDLEVLLFKAQIETDLAAQ
ncbi:hypothetical protein RNZ50_02695 [Paracoccaceae bacterium Fryx2]|nr:hypothetical protein [Paracoccaceae bacterium Fryx2]